MPKDVCNETGNRLLSFAIEIATAPAWRFAMTKPLKERRNIND